MYDVAQVTDREEPSVVSVGWSVDNLKVVLLINSSPHAIFDFERKQGFCRSGFPPPLSNTECSAQGHGWEESASARLGETLCEPVATAISRTFRSSLMTARSALVERSSSVVLSYHPPAAATSTNGRGSR